MSQDALSPRQFFHGSDHEFAPGDKLLSARSRNVEATTSENGADRVWFSNSRSEAKGWGRHVYQVQPDDEPIDSGYIGGSNGETRAYHATSGTIVRRVGKKP